MLEISRIDHVALTVRDVEASVRWYREVLGLKRKYREAWGDEPAVVCAGETCLALFPASGAPAGARDTASGRAGFRHLAFRTDRENFRKAQQELKARGIDFSFQDHGISHSIYFHDPDGYQLEITAYEL